MERKTIFEMWKNKELPEEMQKETDGFAEARNGTEEEKIFRAGFHIAWNKSRYEKLLGLEDQGGRDMDILCGWLHDSYTDENGKEISFTERVCGVLKKDVFHCVSIPEFMTYEMPKEEFFRKVTNIKGGVEIWN